MNSAELCFAQTSVCLENYHWTYCSGSRIDIKKILFVNFKHLYRYALGYKYIRFFSSFTYTFVTASISSRKMISSELETCFVFVYLCDSLNLVQEEDFFRVGDLLRFSYLCDSLNLVKKNDILRVGDLLRLPL